MARGGYRPGAGRPKKSATLAAPAKKAASSKAKAPPKDEATSVAAPDTPLDYMLGVMRDPKVDQARRDRMAIAAAPFMHARREPVGQGKREAAQQAADKAKGGKFAALAPPRLVSSKD